MEEIIEKVLLCIVMLLSSWSMFVLTWYSVGEWLKEKDIIYLTLASLTTAGGIAALIQLFIGLFL